MVALLVVAVFFGAFLLFPIIEVLRGGLTDDRGRPTLVYLAEIFRNRLYLEGLVNSFAIACCTTLAVFCLAVPLAWINDRFEFAGKKWLSAGVLMPMVLPPFVGALGMQRILGPAGALNTLLVRVGFCSPASPPDWLGAGGFWGVVLVEALHLYPILYLNALAAFANVDPLLHEAAADLGCAGTRRFFRITFPLIAPGLFAGGAIVFIWSFTELGAPLMFNFERVTAVQIFNGIKEIGNNPFPYALVIVLLTASAVLYATARLTFGRKAWAMTSKAGVASGQVRLSGMAAAGAILAFAAVTFLAVLPHLGLVGISLSRSWYRTILPTGLTLAHFQAGLSHNLTVPSILNSVRYSTMAVLVAMVLGVLIAVLTVRMRVRFAWLLDALAMLPLAVPGLVLAFGYLAMSQKGRFFHFLDPIQNPTALLVIAYAVRRLPYVVRATVAGLQQTSVSLEEAGANLGASPFTVFRRITAPLITANLIAGGLLAFSFAMLEVSDSLLLAQRSLFFPITKAIYELSMLLGEGQSLAAALGVWTMLFLGATILAASLLLGKRLGALFRI
ncbi:MAG: iron ABC transporter permease [Kiritimatiellaeota bacterium]|nr:iron ABC transporter permease [Kiritimatiellota bacterium]